MRTPACAAFMLLTFGCEGVLEAVAERAPTTPTRPPPTVVLPGIVDEEMPVDPCAPTPTPGSAPMRRLSHDEYQYAVTDLFGDAALAQQVTAGFLQDSVSLGFRNGARFLDVKPVLFQKYQEAAETIAARVTTTARLPQLVPCQPSAGEACARQAIERLLLRAYRRPPAPADVDRHLAVFRAGSQGADFRTGMEWVVLTVLQAPKFLYRLEFDGRDDARALEPFELASRLSFLFWQSLPDDALFEAARAGRLATAADVEREARRLLADPKAERTAGFFEQWLDVDEFELRRDPTAFPGLDGALGALMREESHRFIDAHVRQGEGSFAALFTSPVTFVNEDLARHYGLSGISGPAWVRTSFPAAARRGGVFMTSASLVNHDKATRTSIVTRGLRVRTQLLCQTVATPPDDVPLNLPPVDASNSQAERLAQHRTEAACRGCHQLLDPLGEPFEHLDAVGRVRSVDEGGRPVQTAGEIMASFDADGPVDHGLDLMNTLAQSNEARGCLVTQLFRYHHGREEEPADRCSRQRAFERFASSGWNVRELLVAMTQTDDFLFKPAVIR